MSNKSTLQANNETLGSILSNVLGLPSQESLKHGAYVWKKLTAQGGNFVDFVVSDSETAYPDGGTQDSYWYEKVVEGVDLLATTGYTKIAVDKFTPTSDLAYNNAKLNHSLGVTPYLAIILPNNYNVSGYGTYVNFVVSAYFANNTKAYSQYARKSSAIYVFQDNGTHQGEHSKTQISLLNDGSSHYFKAGIEYTLITMA